MLALPRQGDNQCGRRQIVVFKRFFVIFEQYISEQLVFKFGRLVG
jgi:hypothetical protein